MSVKKPLTVLFSAGETSGDQHAAEVFTALKTKLPTIQAFGMGGRNMARAGIDIRFDASNIGVIGVIEILKHYPEIRRALKLLQQLIITEQPDLLICIDYQKFNLQLARFAKRQGVKVLFYISPQVWASRPGRVKAYAKAVDRMAVIFPFEVPYYQAAQVPVRYVGHPLVDKVHLDCSKIEQRQQFKLDSQQPVVGLLPGSRVNEIERLLPIMLQAAQLLRQKHPQVHFILPQADSISDALLQPYLANTPLNITVIKQQPYAAINCCDAVMTTSGTATLEIALLAVPMVITYRLALLTYYLARSLINIPFIGLPNIIANKAIVKELIQHEATPENLAQEIDNLLTNTTYRDTMLHAFAHLKQQLGTGGAANNVATLTLEMLTT